MKNIFFILAPFFILTNIVQADDCVTCSSELKPFSGLVKNIKILQNPTEVNCADVLKEQAREEYLSNFSKLPQKKALIKGINLEGSADELKFLGKMLDDKPSKDWANASECKTVLCAITKVYKSEEVAYRVLNIAKRDGYIVSLAKDFNINNEYIGQLFTLEEIQKIDLAYKLLPPRYEKLKTLDRIKRLPDGYSSPGAPNAAAYASPGIHSADYNREGEITFLESGFSGAASWGSHAAVHELTHHVDYSQSNKNSHGFSESPDFLKLSGWIKSTKYETDVKTGKKTQVSQWEFSKDKNFVSDYSSTAPAEDFAEAAAHYVYYPNKLKAVDPEKYDFIKNKVFGGKEFISGPEMELSNDEILKICLDDSKELNLYGRSGYGLASISSSCLEHFITDYKYTDPKLCGFNKKQISNYLLDKITPQIEKVNVVLKACDLGLENFSKQCLSEGDFQKTCPISKCGLQDNLREKVRDSRISDRDNQTMNAIQNKMGKQNFIMTALIGGLSGKNKVATNFALTFQQEFLDNASKRLSESYEKESFKFDSKEDAEKKSSGYLMMDKKITESISTFQTTVLSKATRSKEKNLELIKNWAASQSLEDSLLYDELAESLKKYGGFFK